MAASVASLSASTDAVLGAATPVIEAATPVLGAAADTVVGATTAATTVLADFLASSSAAIENAALIAMVAKYALEDGLQTTFTSVARWPGIKVFTYGACAFNSSVPSNIKFEGQRVALEGDPVPNNVGQAIGYKHGDMVPFLPLDMKQHEDDNDDVTHQLLNQQQQSQQKEGKEHSDGTYLASRSPADREAPSARSDMERGLEIAFSGTDAIRIFRDSDFSRHDTNVYIKLLRERLLETPTPSLLQAYRMAWLTHSVSYSHVTRLGPRIDELNAEVDPTRPGQPLFPKKLYHEKSIEFSTQASFASRAINPIGFLFSEDQTPLKEEGISHNVHLLKDADNNGYLSFQGTANLATWVDVNLDFWRYKPDAKKHLTAVVDDQRWELIEDSLQGCHEGFVEILKAFVSHEEFPRMAKKIAGMKSLTVVGFSLGGSLANLFAIMVQNAHDIQSIIDRLRDSNVGTLLRPYLQKISNVGQPAVEIQKPETHEKQAAGLHVSMPISTLPVHLLHLPKLEMPVASAAVARASAAVANLQLPKFASHQ
jgi:hypothetical protein